MINIWIKNLELFEKWVISPSSNIACLDYVMEGVHNGSEKWHCYLTFKNGKKAMVEVKVGIKILTL